MPYAKNSDLPVEVRNALDAKAQSIWRSAFNSALDSGKDDTAAHKIAWGAVKNAGYSKSAAGSWTKASGEDATQLVLLGGQPLQLAIVPDVDLLHEGQKIKATTGPVDFDAAMLADMVEASRDPELREGVVKVGHIDPRFDGEPAMGWTKNLRIQRGKQDGKLHLRGDFVSVPKPMAVMMTSSDEQPAPFRSRSVEVQFGVKTSRRTYKAVLRAVALLGSKRPALETLEDITSHYDVAAGIDEGDDDVVVVSLESADSPDDGSMLRGDDDADRQEAVRMDPKELAKLIGLKLADDVSDEVAEKAVREELAKRAKAPDKSDKATPKADADDKPKNKPPETAPSAAPPPLPEGVVAIDKTVLEELRHGASQGAEARKTQEDERRKSAVTAALSSGRITPAVRDDWERLLAVEDSTQREANYTMLSSLEPAFTVDDPLAMLGHEGGPDTGYGVAVGTRADDDSYYAVYPEERPNG